MVRRLFSFRLREVVKWELAEVEIVALRSVIPRLSGIAPSIVERSRAIVDECTAE